MAPRHDVRPEHGRIGSFVRPDEGTRLAIRRGVRALVKVSALVLVSGCVSFELGDFSFTRVPPDCAGVDGGGVPTALACDVPASVDPADVEDLATFDAIASAAICNIALRCGLSAEQAYCAPRFIARNAVRDAMDAGAFALATARACVRGLARAQSCIDAMQTAQQCEELVSVGGWSVPRALEDMPCTDACAFGTVCVGGRCVVPGAVGDACGGPVPCAFGLGCSNGRCAFASAGQSCGLGVECAPNLVCFGTTLLSGVCTTCAGDDPRPAHRVGCTCTSDEDCPADVATCFRRTCTLRPLPGDECAADGPACLESQCGPELICS